MLRRLFPLYFVIFLGFFGYSLMITIFTPMLLHGSEAILPHNFPESLRTVLLGVALCVYPLGQFLGAPVFGAFSDHFGRKRLLVISLFAATVFYALISFSLFFGNIFWVIFFTFFCGALRSKYCHCARGDSRSHP
ncbi:MFS transporter [Simkania sp.]|uniref:MFS transporter n=1 Tax=Simkania sp. TaxID=34094 RepID=UPI003B518BFF